MNAALISINFTTGEINHTLFDGEFSIERCHALRKSIESDFPGCTWGVIADEEACNERTERILGVTKTKQLTNASR